MTADDHHVGVRLLETGTRVEFQTTEMNLDPGPDDGEFGVRVELRLGPDGDAEAARVVEWGAFGFIFVLGVLSFADARPRGTSKARYVEEDGFQVSDFFGGLGFVRGELHFRADYIRGRRIKTAVIVRQDGTATLATWGRGKAALRWLDRLKGKKALNLVAHQSEESSSE